VELRLFQCLGAPARNGLLPCLRERIRTDLILKHKVVARLFLLPKLVSNARNTIYQLGEKPDVMRLKARKEEQNDSTTTQIKSGKRSRRSSL
jgi:hypothetical protein